MRDNPNHAITKSKRSADLARTLTGERLGPVVDVGRILTRFEY